MLQVNPLTYSDVKIALKSACKLVWINRAIYIPFFCLVATCSWAFSSTIASMPIVPFVGLFFPSLCIVVAALSDQNRKLDVATVLRSTLSVSVYMLFFAIPAVLIMLVMLFKPLALIGFLESFSPGFLSIADVPAVLSSSKILSGAFSFTVVITIFIITELTTRLDMAYLQARHGLTENNAYEKSVELLGSINFAHGLSKGISCGIWVVPMILVPKVGLVFIAIAFTFEYFILKAIYDGSANTDAIGVSKASALPI